MFGSLGSTELIVVLVVVLIVFGAGKLPSVMRDLGKGVSEFKKAQADSTPVAAAPVAASPAPAPVVAPAPVAPPAPAEVRPPQSTAPRA